MNRANRIKHVLEAKFSPYFIEVLDESHRHHGHAGARPEGETHYHVALKAEAFKGQTRVAMHRAVNEALAEEFKTGLHALALSTSA